MSAFDAFPLGQPAFVTNILDRAAHLRRDEEKLFAMEQKPSSRAYVVYRDSLLVPTAFTPNGDGRNDVFRVANLSFQKLIEFRVFNRWGQEVYSTTDNNGGWDGTWKGVAQDMGIYTYIIRVAFPDGTVSTYKGDVTLIR